jgi:branched-chain amino acid transport system ATP-binding protein
MTLLSVQNLEVRYGAFRAVEEVSLEVAEGEIVAIIGPNGAGKSTCFNAVGGQIRPSAGRVLLAGQDIVGLSPERIFRLGVGRTFQVTATVSSMTVRENVQLALISHRRRTQTFWRATRRLFLDEADRLLEAVGMAEQAERPCAVLAYGDLKRLELAIALANEPRLLLMDEPTAGMAPGERAKLMALTTDLSRARGVGVLFTEHDIDIVFSRAERIVVMNRGRVVAAGPPEAVRADRQVQEIYLGGSAEATASAAPQHVPG